MAANVQPVNVTKLDDWSRLYQFNFASSFVEFSAPGPPTITGTPTVTADAGITAARSANFRAPSSSVISRTMTRSGIGPSGSVRPR